MNNENHVILVGIGGIILSIVLFIISPFSEFLSYVLFFSLLLGLIYYGIRRKNLTKIQIFNVIHIVVFVNLGLNLLTFILFDYEYFSPALILYGIIGATIYAQIISRIGIALFKTKKEASK